MWMFTFCVLVWSPNLHLPISKSAVFQSHRAAGMNITKSKRPGYDSQIRDGKVNNKTKVWIRDAFESWRSWRPTPTFSPGDVRFSCLHILILLNVTRHISHNLYSWITLCIFVLSRPLAPPAKGYRYKYWIVWHKVIITSHSRIFPPNYIVHCNYINFFFWKFRLCLGSHYVWTTSAQQQVIDELTLKQHLHIFKDACKQPMGAYAQVVNLGGHQKDCAGNELTERGCLLTHVGLIFCSLFTVSRATKQVFLT